MPTLAFIHTVPGLVERFRTPAETTLVDWSSYAVFDESLLHTRRCSRYHPAERLLSC
jgi:hypothetical protein